MDKEYLPGTIPNPQSIRICHFCGEAENWLHGHPEDLCLEIQKQKRCMKQTKADHAVDAAWERNQK